MVYSYFHVWKLKYTQLHNYALISLIYVTQLARKKKAPPLRRMVQLTWPWHRGGGPITCLSTRGHPCPLSTRGGCWRGVGPGVAAAWFRVGPRVSCLHVVAGLLSDGHSRRTPHVARPESNGQRTPRYCDFDPGFGPFDRGGGQGFVWSDDPESSISWGFGDAEAAFLPLLAFLEYGFPNDVKTKDPMFEKHYIMGAFSTHFILVK